MFDAYKQLWVDARNVDDSLSRYQYWSGLLMIYFMIIFELEFIHFLDLTFKISQNNVHLLLGIHALFSSLLFLVHIFPVITATMRRLLDVGANPNLAYLWLIPFLGIVILPFFTCRRGTKIQFTSQSLGLSEWDQFWNDYPNFSGKLSRREFFREFTLLYLFPFFLLGLADSMLHIQNELLIFFLLFLAFNYFFLLMFFHLLGMLVRRLHDAGHSGAWSLCVCLSIFGWVILLVLVSMPSREINRK